jgi:hypothetical protein
MADNAAFRQALYQGIDQKFDGETNVLVKDLLASQPAVADQWERAAQRLGFKGVSNALAAFQGINTRNAYPQLYIPFYEELKEEGKLGKTAPIVVLYYANDQPTYPGFTLDAAQGLIKTGQTVDEAQARQTEVWVISLNERVDSQGELIKALGSLEPVSNNGRLEFNNYAYMSHIAVRCHGDSWAGGGTELHIVRRETPINYAGPFTDIGNNGPAGEKIGDWTRPSIQAGTIFNMNFVLHPDWGTNAIYVYLIVFDYDGENPSTVEMDHSGPQGPSYWWLRTTIGNNTADYVRADITHPTILNNVTWDRPCYYIRFSF